jgi:hypothetical protein
VLVLPPLQAKRLAKDLNAQMAAVEAAAAADLLLARSPAGSAALRAMATRLEAAAAAITPPAASPSVAASTGMGLVTGSTQAPTNSSSSSSTAVTGAAAFQELLVPRVAACKRRCEVEKAAEELHRAAAACRTLADLPKLEAAILTARKVRREGYGHGQVLSDLSMKPLLWPMLCCSWVGRLCRVWQLLPQFRFDTQMYTSITIKCLTQPSRSLSCRLTSAAALPLYVSTAGS